jgi:N-methylhydantoinase B
LKNLLRGFEFGDPVPKTTGRMSFRKSLGYTRSVMRADPIELEVFKHLFHSIAEEMGAALRRTAFSPNIKERRDYSCALFDSVGNVLAMGDHMPVHLGSMPMSVRAAIAELRLMPGDVAMLNDPFRGGTHLPDITVVAPVFVRRTKHDSSPEFFVAARAHHADVGGTYAGSMGPCREIYQEGFRIPPVKIVRGGTLDRDILALLLNNVRTPQEREGDLSAQLAACHTGGTRLRELCMRYGIERVQRAARSLLDYSEKMMCAFLATVPAGSYAAEDVLDDDGVRDEPVRIAVRITFPRATKTAGKKPRPVIVDFTGSSPQVEGSINAVEAITYSACFYVFRCLLREDVPATAGLMRPVQLIAPQGTIVNACPPAAVAGGNVETSQRIVDVLLRALAQALPEQIPAASSGTMNNLTIGGMDDRRSMSRPNVSNSAGVPRSIHPLARAGPAVPFAYYETIAGGSGASAAHDGVSGVHTHMTNSLNTPAEALEYSYPLRVTKYALRAGSGGDGKHRGGDGIVREIEVLADATVTILSDRRKSRPYGLAGGHDGSPGQTEILRADGSRELMPSKGSTRLLRSERVRVETPGGGGWGVARD